MNRLTIIAAAFSITVAGPGCGPIAGPDTRCEDEGGSWICDGNVGPAGGEKCWCDSDPHDAPPAPAPPPIIHGDCCPRGCKCPR